MDKQEEGEGATDIWQELQGGDRGNNSISVASKICMRPPQKNKHALEKEDNELGYSSSAPKASAAQGSDLPGTIIWNLSLI